MKIVNDYVAVEPIVFNHEQANRPNAIKHFDASDKLLNSLVSTVVVYDSNTYKAGQRLFFRADVANMTESKRKFDHDSKTFVLLPENIVVGVEG